MKQLSSILLLIFINLSIFSYNYQDYNFEDVSERVKTFLQSASNTEPPKIVDEWALFSIKPTEKTNYVGVAFSHENFKTIHKFSKNRTETFIFAYKIPTGSSNLKYRIIRDGIWMSDESNKNFIIDNRGVKISTIHYDSNNINYKIISPNIDKNFVTFRYFGEEKQNVFLTGDFISWDPFSYKMVEKRAGEYIFTLYVNAGEYRYYFLVNGDKTIDKYNFNVDLSKIDGPVSYFKIN